MSARKTERLLNLVIALLATRRPRTAEEVRRAVPGYADDDGAFKRMFERDKEELRELGVPLETVSDAWSEDVGYRIGQRDYALPEITLEPDEAAAVSLAARVWQQASLGEAAAWAARKLAAGGAPVDLELPRGLEPRLESGGPSFAGVQRAVVERTPIRFTYRPAGGAPAARTLEPWGCVYRHGVWYVVGNDLDRHATRAFRLSRIVGTVTAAGPPGSVTVPSDVDLAALVDTFEPTPTRTARLRVRPGAAGDLRRQANEVEPDVIDVGFADAERFAADLAGYGADVTVLAPADLRAAVIGWLRPLAGESA